MSRTMSLQISFIHRLDTLSRRDPIRLPPKKKPLHTHAHKRKCHPGLWDF